MDKSQILFNFYNTLIIISYFTFLCNDFIADFIADFITDFDTESKKHIIPLETRGKILYNIKSISRLF